MNIEEIKKSMQRERKFRAWLSALGKMTYPMPLIEHIDIARDESINIMDYTGLKDSNGQEVYEGDVCELDNGVGFVITLSSGCYWANYGDMGKEFLFKVLKDHSCKVIGNIFENPELLQE